MQRISQGAHVRVLAGVQLTMNALRIPLSAILVVAALANNAAGATRHVPAEYSTIQAALDALIGGDTVLVDTGVYEEALQAPSLDFTLRGNVTDTVGDYSRPVIDPSALPDPTHVACLRQDSGNVTIEDFGFRNGPAMYPNRGDATGGVLHSYGECTLRRCIFDSTYNALGAPDADVTLSRCRFRNTSGWGVVSYRRTAATDCDFHSQMVNWAQLTGRDGTRIERCHFWGNFGDLGIRSFLNCGPTDVVVRDCVFGPAGSGANIGLYFPCANCVFEGNIIDSVAGTGSIFLDHMLGPGSLDIRNNVVSNCSTPDQYSQSSLCGFDLQIWGCDTCTTEFDSNTVANCTGFHGAPGLLLMSGSVNVHHSRFTGLHPAAVRNEGGTCVMRENLLYDNGTAVYNNSGAADARWNWWGDSTGPFSPANPDGQGDTVVGNVQFDPWYADTLFFTRVSPEPSVPLASEYLLAVYPNPFNPTAIIRFSNFKEQRVAIDVFNITGQKVRTLADGRFTAGYHTLQFDARDLPTGIYFAHIRAGDFVKTEKLVLLK